jgi:hypothetical protein
MAKAKTVIQGTIKGAFEDVRVGDKVMVVTTGRSATRVNKGTYIGYIEGSRYGTTVKKAVIEVEATRFAQFKPDGTEFDWRKDYDSKTYPTIKDTLTQRQISYTRRTTLKLNRIATLK